MQFSSRLTVATHILLYIAEYEKEEKITSTVLADTTNVNPVNIRKTLALLKQAGMIDIKSGVGGAYLIKKTEEIMLSDIFDAVEDPDAELFHFHDNPNTNCPVGRSIKSVLDTRLERLKQTMKDEMKDRTLADMFYDMQKEIGRHGG